MDSYQQISKEILQNIDSLAAEADSHGAPEFRAKLGVIQDKLHSNAFNIVVMGQFKRGKTTFINSLLGAEVLPSAVIPLTSINTVLKYGEVLDARVHFLSGEVTPIELEDVPAYVTERDNPENRLGVGWVEVYYPSPYLEDGVSLVDTPGTGSTFLHNDEVAYSYLSRADAVIFMLSADPPVSKSELEFLNEIRHFVRKVFFVQNKMDYLDENELAESLDFNSQVVARALGENSIEIFPVSARQALKGKLEANDDLLAQSNLQNFTERLGEFLMEEKGMVLLESALKNLDKVLAEEIAGAELSAKLLTQPLAELEEKTALFRQEMVSLKRDWDEINYLLQGDSKALVEDVLDAHVALFRRQTEPVLLERFEEFFEEHGGLRGSALAAKVDAFIKESIRDAFTHWRYEEEERIEAEFKQVERRFREKANGIANKILEIAGNLFEISLLTIDAELDLSEEGEFWFKLNTSEALPNLFEFLGSAFTKALPKRMSNQLLKKKAREQFLDLFDRHCGRVRYDFFLRLQKSTQALKGQVNELIQETMYAIESSIDQALRMREEGGKNLESSIERLEKRKLSLGERREDLKPLRESLAKDAGAVGG